MPLADATVKIFEFPGEHKPFILKDRETLTVAYSDTASRPRFRNRTDVFSTPSSTLETSSSWPLRRPSTLLRPFSDRLVSLVVSCHIRHDRHRHPSETMLSPRCDVDIVVVDAFLSTKHVAKRVLNAVPGGPYILKNRAIYFENICINRIGDSA